MRTRADVVGKLRVGLENISLAPLKPQQHLYMLKTNLVPAVYHQLVLAASTKKYLLWLDRTVRAAVRSWLKLPHDTPKAYFHAPIYDGGLGIVSLELQRSGVPEGDHSLIPTAMHVVDPLPTTKAGWYCIREHTIPTQAGLRKPDLIFHHQDRDTFVLDVTIVADNSNLSEAHTHKTQYYDELDIRCWIQRNISGRV
ncbi:hypothetical protein ACROYT_G015530 [Oculina patagonica]